MLCPLPVQNLHDIIESSGLSYLERNLILLALGRPGCLFLFFLFGPKVTPSDVKVLIITGQMFFLYKLYKLRQL